MDTAMAPEPGWDHLPGELLHYIARLAAGSQGRELAVAKTRCRAVCRSWRDALPLGEAHSADASQH